MFDFIRTHKKTALATVLIIVGFVVYGVFFVDSGTTTSLTSTQNEVAAIEGGEEILALLEELQDINLDTTLFTSQEFQGLIDFSVTLTPQPVGRSNPFAPIFIPVQPAPVAPPATTTDPES